jgi:hypothetical protein
VVPKPINRLAQLKTGTATSLVVEYEEHKARSETFAKYIFFISLSNASAIYLFIQDIMQVYMK